jgi:5-methylcytosine-specific restriction endonuclease McrA
MISASDVPACSACGCREVHPVTKTTRSPFLNPLTRQVEETGEFLETFYSCRQCGRDVTDAWKDIQPAPEPKPVIGSPDPEPAEPPDAHALGIAATNGSST